MKIALKITLLFFVAFNLSATSNSHATEKDALTIISPSGEHVFYVEIANTPATRQQGLMNRMTLAENEGMLLLFNYSHPVEMWMKNTYIPLDMLFLDKEGRVLDVYYDAIPLSLQKIKTPPNTRAVLELNSGTLQKYQIIPGSQAIHSLLKD